MSLPSCWPIAKNLVEDGVSIHWMTDASAVIRATACSDASLDDEFFEGKVLMVLILSIMHSSASKAAHRVYSNSSYHQYSNLPSKRQKTSMVASFDRLIMAADLKNGPDVVAIFMKSTSESYKYLEYCSATIGVGRMFYVVEPSRSDRLWNNKVPIVSTNHPLVPLKFGVETIPMTSSLSSCAMTIPKEAGEQLYFSYHNVKDVSISRFEIAVVDVSCGGSFCDRTQILEKNAACGCLYSGEKSPCVGDYTVTFPVPVTIRQVGKVDVAKCRSLRTTKLFFKNLTSFGQQSIDKIHGRFHEVRTRVRAMVNYINGHDGWTVVGWFKKGEVQDSSSGEKIESDVVTLHISLLIPSNDAVANGRDVTFETMRISTDAVVGVDRLSGVAMT